MAKKLIYKSVRFQILGHFDDSASGSNAEIQAAGTAEGRKGDISIGQRDRYMDGLHRSPSPSLNLLECYDIRTDASASFLLTQ